MLLNGTYNPPVGYRQSSPLSGDSNRAVSFGGSGYVALSNLPVSTAAGGKTTVEFWMHWNGTSNTMPFGFTKIDLWFPTDGTRFGFNTSVSDVYGIPASGLANRWVHVAAIFHNGDAFKNELYIDGVKRPLSWARRGGTATGPDNASAYATPSAQISGWLNNTGHRFQGSLDEVAIYDRALTPTEIAAHYAAR